MDNAIVLGGEGGGGGRAVNKINMDLWKWCIVVRGALRERESSTKITQSTTKCNHNATRLFWVCGFVLAENRIASRTFREKKQQQQQSRVFFHVIFDTYTHVDNRERAGAGTSKGDEFHWKQKHMKKS